MIPIEIYNFHENHKKLWFSRLFIKIVIRIFISDAIFRYDFSIFRSSPGDRYLLLGISLLEKLSEAQLNDQDSELLQSAIQNVTNMFDRCQPALLPPAELLLRWNTYSTVTSPKNLLEWILVFDFMIYYNPWHEKWLLIWLKSLLNSNYDEF